MADLMAFIALMAGGGYALRRLGLVRPEAADDLSRIVFYFTLPPLVFLALHRADLSAAMLLMPAVAWGLLVGGLFAALLLTRILGLPREKAAPWVIVTVFGNATFIGLPVIQGFYGEEGLTLAIFYDLLGGTLVGNTVVVVFASVMGGHGSVRAIDLARRVVSFPPIWGLVLGLALRGVPIPGLVESLLERVSALTAPIIMLSIGLTLRFRHWREDLGLVVGATFGKLLVLPLIAWGVLSFLGLPEDMLRVAVMQAAMPTMLFSLTLALLFGLNKTLVVNTIMLSTLVSFGTLPLWRLVLGP